MRLNKQMTSIKNKHIFLFFVAVLLSFPFLTSASTTNGTIDSVYKYAWSNDIGWINFAPTGDSASYKGLVVTDTTVTGYAWNDTYGWINFGPFVNNTEGGVKNTPEGILSGSAWGQNLGWISFSGVIINSSGQFTGTATGQNVGTINFNLTKCTDCGVKTDWRPASVRPVATGGNSGIVGSSGGYLPPVTQPLSPPINIIPTNTSVPPATTPNKPSQQTGSNAGNSTTPSQGSKTGSTTTPGSTTNIPQNTKVQASLIKKLSSSFLGQVSNLILKILNWFEKMIRLLWAFIVSVFQ